MKKLLLGLGSIAAVAAPIVGVVSCGNKNVNKLEVAKKDAIEKLNMMFPNKQLDKKELKLINDSKDSKAIDNALTKIIKDRAVVTNVGTTGMITVSGVDVTGTVMLHQMAGDHLINAQAVKALEFIKTKYDAMTTKKDLTTFKVSVGMMSDHTKMFMGATAEVNTFLKATANSVVAAKSVAVSALVALSEATTGTGTGSGMTATTTGMITESGMDVIGTVVLHEMAGDHLTEVQATKALDSIKAKYDAMTTKKDLTTFKVSIGTAPENMKVFMAPIMEVNTFIKATGDTITTAKTAAVSALVALREAGPKTITNTRAKMFMDKVLGVLATVRDATAATAKTKELASKVLAEFNAGIAVNGIVTGRATGDAVIASTSNNNYDHTKTLVRVLDNEDKKLSFSFNMSKAKTEEIFGHPDATHGWDNMAPITTFTDAFEAALKVVLLENADTLHIRAGFYKSTQRINGVAPAHQIGSHDHPNTNPDDYFRFTFNIVKADVVAKTGVATSAGTVASYSDSFKAV